MCDQTQVTYSDGDVVWVKIGPIWWPGVVKDISKEGNEEEVLDGLKYKPIATVRFFNEEKFEFVKNLDHIYKYNCSRKDEFLKKGLDKFRAGAKHMVKFPEDISKAEELVKGDINIVNDPKFAPPEKRNYSELFGTPKKKTRKTEDLTLKSKLPLKKRLSAPAHRLASSTFSPRTPNSAELTCPLCDFSANLVPTMSSHFLYFHSSQQSNYGDSSAPKRARPTPGTNKRRGRTPKLKIDTPNSVEPSPKSTPVTKTVVNSISPEKKKRFTDALLADWSEDEDKDKDDGNPVSDLSENINVSESAESEVKELNLDNTPVGDDVNKEVEGENHHNSSGSVEGSNDNDRRETSSCFDFDDEDDGFIGMSDAYTYGRKIPRVIPVKDKTDLGRDLEVDEVFKKKPDSEDMEDEVLKRENLEKPLKRKRGRPARKVSLSEDSDTNVNTSKKAIVKRVNKTAQMPMEGLAATRKRRPGARKSYLNLVIEKVEDDTEHEQFEVLESENPELNTIETEESPKPSRRKQDLKRQKLLEYDDAMLVGKMQKKQQLEQSKKIIVIEKEDIQVKNSVAALKEEPSPVKVSQKTEFIDEDLTAQVESLLAETTAPTVLAKPPSFSPTRKTITKVEDLEEIEYLEDDPPAIISPVKKIIPTSPIKKIKTLEIEQTVKKSAIPQWKQGIQESLKLNKELLCAKEGATKVEPPKTNIIKLSTHRVGQPQQKSPRYLILSPQQGLGSNSSNSPQRFKLANLPRTAQSSLVQIDPTRKKVIKLSSAVQPKQMKGEGIQMIKNLIGPGKTAVILKDITGSGLGRKIMVNPEKRCYIQRKGPDGNITLKSIVPPKRTQQIVFNNQTVKFVPKVEEMVEAPVIEPVVEHGAAETVTNLASSHQVALPPTADVQTTYMLVTVDGQTVLQAVDSSLLPATYNVQPDVSTQLYETPNDEMKQVFPSPGQDILAEALANTNVLESEMPLMMSSVVQETCVTMQKPIMTPLEIPSIVLPDPSLIIAPVVQETSVTLQKPIMTPLVVPTSVVADTSGLEPPPLPPTPTAEDVMMEDPEDSLMIADQPQQPAIVSDDTQNQKFFIDDSQEAGEEINSFQSMPLLNEESTASEEHIGDQNFDVQGTNLENNEYLPSSTNPDLESEQREPIEQEIPLLPYNTDETQEEVESEEKDALSLPFLTEEGFVVTGEVNSSQETEVTSTTCDSKEDVVEPTVL